MNPEILEKLEELTQLCRDENELPTAAVLLTLQGCIAGGTVDILHVKVHQLTEEVLLPMLKARKEMQNVQKN